MRLRGRVLLKFFPIIVVGMSLLVLSFNKQDKQDRNKIGDKASNFSFMLGGKSKHSMDFCERVKAMCLCCFTLLIVRIAQRQRSNWQRISVFVGVWRKKNLGCWLLRSKRTASNGIRLVQNSPLNGSMPIARTAKRLSRTIFGQFQPSF